MSSSFKALAANELEASLKKTKGRKHSKFFYRVINHHELFKVGESFYEDFKKGIRSFGISSIGYEGGQKKSILGLASFFDHQEIENIAIVTEDITGGVFSEVFKNSEKSFTSVGEDRNVSLVKYKFYEHFDLVPLDGILTIEAGLETESEHTNVLTQFVEHYDIIFWDIPSLDKLQNNSQYYYPLILELEALSIVVTPSRSQKEEIKKTKQFFSDYGIHLKGFIMNSDSME